MKFKAFLPYILALTGFILVALIYFSPVLEGKKIYQSDITQYIGMSKKIKDFRATHHEEPYWTDAAFGGMPAYQISAYYPYDFIKKVDRLIRFLPRPADYLWLYFISFFVLMLSLKVDWRLAALGALGFGFSTYLIIIIGVGHNAKAHAIGYMPLVLAGVIHIFKKKYFLGFLLTSMATALEIAAGHIQMTYYLFFMLVFLGIFEFINALKAQKLKDFFTASGILIIAGIIALLINANHLLPTKEYASESTRSKSELHYNPDGTPKETTSGLSKDYITEYSYGILETFNLFIPRLMGGGNSEDLGSDSNTYRFLKSKIGVSQARGFAKHTPTYWGKQPIVAAPAYIGAVWIFLLVLSLFIVHSKTKKWLLASIILALLLSWGKNFGVLTDLFIRYVPLYNKFRAVSSIQVIIELAVPVLGVLGLQKFLSDPSLPNAKKEKALLYSVGITGGIALFFLVFGSSWFAFEGANDAYYNSMIPHFSEALVQDRKAMMFHDSLRSLLLVLAAAGSLFVFLKGKLKTTPLLIVFFLLIIYDGVSIAKRYVNDEDFVPASKMEKPFQATEADKAILKDQGHYRVADFSGNPMNEGRTSYFHNAIGGYHAAKPRRYQELFDYQIAKNNVEVLNMLNTKYLILSDEKGNQQVQENPDAYGNAWFVTQIRWVQDADKAIKAMDSISKEVAVLEQKYQAKIPATTSVLDSTDFIRLERYQANRISYKSQSKQAHLALFSEMYYPYGWKAFIDGKEQEILRANYVLRALWIPAGKHQILFVFKPEVVQKGAHFSLLGYALFILIGVLLWLWSKKRAKK